MAKKKEELKTAFPLGPRNYLARVTGDWICTFLSTLESAHPDQIGKTFLVPVSSVFYPTLHMTGDSQVGGSRFLWTWPLNFVGEVKDSQ